MHINRIKRYIIVLAGLVFFGWVPVEVGKEKFFPVVEAPLLAGELKPQSFKEK